MLVLGLQGSPRKKGNTNYLLRAFMAEAEKQGARTRIVDVTKKRIVPCIGCGTCEKKGFCITKDDDMTLELYPLLREADVVVAASPVYFYNVTAQLKALIDRSQTLWSRRYRLKLDDPGSKTRRGFVLSLGATRGKNLFVGLRLTMQYFFDALSAGYEGNLEFWQIEHPGDMEKHPTVREEVKDAAAGLLSPLVRRKKILFACRENACRSQMAAAFARYFAGDKIDVSCAGSTPAEKVNPDMVTVMQEKGIDMAFRGTRSLNDAAAEERPDMIITMGCGEACPFVPGAEIRDWALPDPAGKPIAFMREVRDEIENKVKALMDNS
ncbi:MAG: NAD(P)H-dependent oxidoreductase [Pseudomonadota bacterium]